MRQHHLFCALLAFAGCATSEESSSGRRTTPRRGEEEGGAASERSDPNAIPPEKFDELDQYFRKKADNLAYRCYSSEAEKTGKKYEGNLSLSMVIRPSGKKPPAEGEEGEAGAGKAVNIKVTGSSLKQIGGEVGSGKGIEECVIAEVQTWEWPDVPARAPFSGSLNFKSRW